MTGAGVLLGTVGYMSPEQVSGSTVDYRSGLFAWRRALRNADRAVRLPARLVRRKLDRHAQGRATADRDVHIRRARLARANRDALSGRASPGERFQSARDLAFALSQLAAPSSVFPAVEDGRFTACGEQPPRVRGRGHAGRDSVAGRGGFPPLLVSRDTISGAAGVVHDPVASRHDARECALEHARHLA